MSHITKASDLITGFNGLTKREYFAIMIMQGLPTFSTQDAVFLADSLIIELNKENGETKQDIT